MKQEQKEGRILERLLGKIMNSYLTPYYVVGFLGPFFKHFLIQTFQQPCASGTDEELKLREVQ